jgi:hypothetical protein
MFLEDVDGQGCRATTMLTKWLMCMSGGSTLQSVVPNVALELTATRRTAVSKTTVRVVGSFSATMLAPPSPFLLRSLESN